MQNTRTVAGGTPTLAVAGVAFFLLAWALCALAEGLAEQYVFDGDSAKDRFGFSVSGAGDVDGDGHDDVIVGAYQDDDGGKNSGSARVFSGKDGSTLHTFDGDSAGDQFGQRVSAAGDVNGDGYDDVIVGAFFDDDNGSDAGSARVLSGKDGTTLYTFDGDSAGDEFGSVAAAGDVNADGYDDLIVGAGPGDYARVFSGKDGTTLYTFSGDSTGDLFGKDVSGAGDVNGDGCDDVIVGAKFDDNGGTDSGSARVFSGKDGTTLYTFHGDSAGDRLGNKVGGAGDVNADGYADVIVGIRLDDDNGTDSGSARVYSGKDGRTLFTFSGGAAGDQFGGSACGAGDVNGDGYDDVAVGAPKDDDKAGSVTVFSGKDGSILHTFYGDGAGDHFGISLGGAIDVDGDGKCDIVAGAWGDDDNGTNAGRAFVFTGGGPETIAEDDFESGGLSGGTGWGASWTASGDAGLRTDQSPHSGGYHLRLRSDTGYLSRSVDLGGRSSVTLSFYAKVKSFEKKDKAWVKVSDDGVTYTTVKTFVNGDDDNRYHRIEIDLSGFTMSDSFEIVFEAGMNSSKDYLYIDDIEFTGVP